MLSSGGYAFNICVLMKMIIPLKPKKNLTFWADFLKITVDWLVVIVVKMIMRSKTSVIGWKIIVKQFCSM